ncbi:hypothetical protein ACLB2K_041866 [Fragaria x ananassa]
MENLEFLSVLEYQFRLAETTKIGGTIGYLPPESFQERSVATAKSDVFSFGIVVMEVVSGRRAVDLACPDDQIILLDWIRKLSDEGKLLQAGDSRIPDGSYQLVGMEYQLHLALLCTLQNPQLRPNMKWVVEALSGNIYGKLPGLPSFQCQPLYISLSSASNSSTRYTIASTTATFASSILSNYVTTTGETIYATAENGSSRRSKVSSTESFPQKKATFPLVETPREISYMEIISATNNFADSQRVAELDFGTAYQGFLNNRHHVLVKRLGMKTCPALRSRYSNELRNLGRLRHRNLVQLRGWCTEQGEMLVVYDYLADRLLSLQIWLHGCMVECIQSQEEQDNMAKSERFAIRISNVENMALFAAKVYASYRSGSLAIIASTLDSLLDLLSCFILWFTAFSMQTPNLYQYPIGKRCLQPLVCVCTIILQSNIYSSTSHLRLMYATGIHFKIFPIL